MKLEWHLMSESQPEMTPAPDGGASSVEPLLIQFYRYGRKTPDSPLDYAVGLRYQYPPYVAGGEILWEVDGGECYPNDADVHAWAVLEKLNTAGG